MTVDDLAQKESVRYFDLQGSTWGDRLSDFQAQPPAGSVANTPENSGFHLTEDRDPNRLVGCVARLAPLLHAHISAADNINFKVENDGMAKKKAGPRTGPAPKLDKGRQLGRVRKICFSIPGITEKLSHGAPTFFTPKRVFAMFVDNHHADGHVAAWLPAAPGVQAALIEEAPDTYFRPPYVGVSGWVGVELAKVDDEQLGALIREAFRIVQRG